MIKLNGDYTLLIGIGMIWRFQLHWNKLEWVNTRSKIKRKNPIQNFQEKYILIKMIERLVGLAIHY